MLGRNRKLLVRLRRVPAARLIRHVSCGGNSSRRLWLNGGELMPPLFRPDSNPFDTSGLDVVVVMRLRVDDKTVNQSDQSPSQTASFIQHYVVSTNQRYIHCVRKKRDQNIFCNISYITLWQFWWNSAYSFLNNFAATVQRDVNVSHLTWMSLHYLVKLEMIIAHVLQYYCVVRETPEFIPPQLWSSNLPDLNPVDNSVWKILQVGGQNMHHWSGAIDDATDGANCTRIRQELIYQTTAMSICNCTILFLQTCRFIT